MIPLFAQLQFGVYLTTDEINDDMCYNYFEFL